jgi:signal transduction histidine kinase
VAREDLPAHPRRLRDAVGAAHERPGLQADLVAAPPGGGAKTPPIQPVSAAQPDADEAAADSREPGYPLAFFLLLGLLLAGFAAVMPAVGPLLPGVTWGELAMWTGFIAASHLLVLPALPRNYLEVSLGAPVITASAVLLPPPLVVLINFIGFVNERELRLEAPLALSLFNRAQLALSAGAAAVAAQAQPWGQVVGAVVAVLVYNLLNTIFVTLSLTTRRRVEVSQAARMATAPFPGFMVDFGLVTLLALYVVLAYDTAGPFAVGLLALPLWLGFSALRSSRKAEDRAEELADRVRELETLNAAATEFLTARRGDHASFVATGALGRALDSDQVDVALDGHLHRDDLRSLSVPGAEPAAVGVPHGLSERQLAVVEAIAGLLGMTLVRQQLEQDLAEVQRARAALSGRILEEGTRERSRIALEIHDDVLPSLAAAQIQADNVRSAIAAGAVDRASDIARATYEAAHAGIGRLREVLDDLHRQILVPGALRPHLLDALAELRMHHGIDGELVAAEELPPLPHAVEILVLETVRGCLANVARHAGAGAIEVHLDVTEATIAVEVRDDGRGFDPEAVEEGHHGLALMAQRVELARGRFAVDSAPGKGTRVRAEVPM